MECLQTSSASSPIESLETLSMPTQAGGPETDELSNLAHSIISESKQARPSSTLETAIFLLRQVASQQPWSPCFRLVVLKRLAQALLLRYNQWGRTQDAHEAIHVIEQAIKAVTCPSEQIMENADFSQGSVEPEEQHEMLQLARSMMNEFSEAVEASNIDTAIWLCRQSLECQSTTNVNRTSASFDLSDALIVRFYLNGHLKDVNEAITQLQAAVDRRPPPDPQRFRDLVALGAALCSRFILCDDGEDVMLANVDFSTADEEDGVARELLKSGIEALDLDLSVDLIRQSLYLRPSPHPLQASSLGALAQALRKRAKQNGEADIEESIALGKEALGLMPPTHPDRHIPLESLATTLVVRWTRTGKLADLNEAVAMFRESVDLSLEADENRATTCISLAAILEERYDVTSEVGDLNQSISSYRKALDILPASHHRLYYLTLAGLSGAILKRYERNNQLADLDESIILAQQSLDLLPAGAPKCPHALDALASALRVRSQLKGDPADAERSVTLHQEVLSSLGNRSTAESPSNLSCTLLTRFGLSGQLSDVDEAVDLARQGMNMMPATNPNFVGSLAILGSALSERYEQRGQITDLDEAIGLYQRALDIAPPTHSRCHYLLNNLGNALHKRFHANGQLADLEKSIALRRDAVDQLSQNHSDRSSSLSGLAKGLFTRFEHTGDLRDLEESISIHRECLDAGAALQISVANSHSDLANVLARRYQQKGRLVDLDESIHHYRKASALTSQSSPRFVEQLHNLAYALSTRFKQTEHPADLDESITLSRNALELQPTHHSMRYSILNLLGLCISNRFERDGNLADLEESVSLHTEALNLLPEHHPGRSCVLNNLSIALRRLFDGNGDLADLEKSIDLQRQSVGMLYDNHPDRYRATNLGSALITLYSATQKPQHLEQAMDAFRYAAMSETAPLLSQFQASQKWARQADTFDHPSAADAFQRAIYVLPRLASLDMSLHDRQEVLTQTRGFSSLACNWAIRSGQLEKAVEFLCAARTIFWSQIRHLRTPSDELEYTAPLLSKQLRSLSAELENFSKRSISRSLDLERVREVEKEAAQARVLNEQRNLTLGEIRKIPGFEDFLLPKSFHHLKRSASNGPVVLLNACESKCDGLLITRDGVKHIPFAHADLYEICRLWDRLWSALSRTGCRSDSKTIAEQMCSEYQRKGIRVPEGGGSTPQELFRHVLAVIFVEVALPIIEALNLEIIRDSPPPRIWLCPTGPFVFLPLHAAGVYEGDYRMCFSDFAIISYTPTLETLLIPSPPPTESTLLTIHSNGAREQYVPAEWLIALGTKATPSSVEKVVDCLPKASFAHFACHGLQDLDNPLESALLLRDGHLKMSKIMQQEMPNAKLAFLSACETAKGTPHVMEESMHVAATLLFSGFRGVVGTLWTIHDDDAPEVADTFYRYLFRKGKDAHPDATEAAYALHLAVKKLREEKKVPYERWLPFVHIGI